MADQDIYCRYYVGHKGKFGHEFLEFEFKPNGQLRYANNSEYKKDTMIRKEMFVTRTVLAELRRIIVESEITKEDDNEWPAPDRIGQQELEVIVGNEHISFCTTKLGSLMQVQQSKDPEGLRSFYYLVQDNFKSLQDLKCLVFSLISAHFKIQARRLRRAQLAVHAITNVKLPATHKEASTRALEQLKASSSIGNRYAMEKKSSIIAIGLTVAHTPVEIREKLSIPEAEWPRAISELCSFPHIEEAAVLSTCNRMELYCVGLSWHRGVREVEEWMSHTSGIPLAHLRKHMFLYRDRDATAHLLRVAGGLDSLVMGEGQILAQVKQVHNVGQNCDGFGRHLNSLFRQAITAGKRVRTETSISSGAVSVSSAAAELAQLKLPSHSFDDARICIIGAGKMSRLLVKHLASKGCKEVMLLNRSMGRAEELAAEFPDIAFSIHLMPDLLPCVAASDCIFVASGSEQILLAAADLAGMPTASTAVGGLRRFFDISVPRNVHSDINSQAADAAHVYNVDDLREVVEANKEARKQAAAEAELLLREEQLAFECWRDGLATVPTIKALRSKAEMIRSVELEKALNKLGEGLTKKQLRAVEDLSRGIINKLLHGPMTALRCDSSDTAALSETLSNMEALERMFELQQGGDLITQR